MRIQKPIIAHSLPLSEEKIVSKITSHTVELYLIQNRISKLKKILITSADQIFHDRTYFGSYKQDFLKKG